MAQLPPRTQPSPDRISDGEAVYLVFTFIALVCGLIAPPLAAVGALMIAGWAVRRISGLLATVGALRAEIARLKAETAAEAAPPSHAPAPVGDPLAGEAPAPPAALPAAPSAHLARPGPTAMAPTPSPPPPPPPPPAARPAPTAPAASQSAALNVEARLGTVWFSRIGGVLLLIGALLGYRYGITDNTVRTALGFAAGIALLGAGHVSRRRHHAVLAQALTGTGLGVLYVTIHAAAMIFSPPTIGQPVAFALMAAVTVAGVALAVGYNAPAIGLLAMLGGFVTPFALSSGAGDFRLLFAYVAVLDLSLLLVAMFKRWPLYNYLLFAATWLIYLSWWAVAAERSDYDAAFIAATAFFAIFLLLTVVQHVVQRQPSRPGDLALLVGNALIYFGAGLALLPATGHARTVFALAMTAAYVLLGWTAQRRQPDDRLLHISALGLAAVFLTAAVPVALRGPWLTAAWAIEGAVLIIAGFAAGVRPVRVAGLTALALAAIRLMFWETPATLLGDPAPAPVLRLFTFLVPIAAGYVAAWAYARWQRVRETVGVLAGFATFITMWYIAVEVLLCYLRQPSTAAPIAALLAIAAAWGAYGLILALADVRFRSPVLRHGARAVLGLSLLIVLGGLTRFGLWDNALPGWERPVAYAVVVGGSWLTEWSFRLRRAQDWGQGVLSLVAVGIGFVATAVELHREVPAAVSTSAIFTAWGVYTLLLTAVGLRLRSVATRLLAAGLTAVTLLGTVVAAPALANGPWPWRIAAYCLVYGGVYAQAWLLHRRARGASPGVPGPAEAEPTAAEAERRTFATLALSAAGLTIIWLAYQFDSFYMTAFRPVTPAEQSVARAALPLGISGLWGVYGFIVLLVGFAIRNRAARLVGTGILGLTLLKVGLWDMWRLAVVWRYWIVLGLGAVFTGAAYMYSRLGRTGPSDPVAAEAVEPVQPPSHE